MLSFLNIIQAGVIAVTTVNYYADKDFDMAGDLGAVSQVEFHREFWREDGKGKCVFKGLSVPFSRDWDEEVNAGEGATRIIKATPEKRQAFAIIVQEKVCEGKPVEHLFRAAEFSPPWGGTNLNYKRKIEAFDLLTKHRDVIPKWYPQVMATIAASAEAGNEAAVKLLETSKPDRQLIAAILAGENVDERVDALRHARETGEAIPTQADADTSAEPAVTKLPEIKVRENLNLEDQLSNSSTF